MRNELFSGDRLEILTNKVTSDIKIYLSSLNESVLDNFSPTQLSIILDTFSINIPIVHFDKISYEEKIENVSKRQTPLSFDMGLHDSFPRTVLYFYIPCENISLLRYAPKEKNISGVCPVTINRNSLEFKIIVFGSNTNIKNDSERTQKWINSNLTFLIKDINQFNLSIPNIVSSEIKKLKDELVKKRERSKELGIPIRHIHTKQVFNLDKEPKLDLKIKNESEIDDGLSERDYNSVLDLIYKSGKAMESTPSLYKGKGEEYLRDQIVYGFERNILNASVTSESKNNKGKTDILLKRNDKVLMVSECKFWKGKNIFNETIEQLQRYLIHSNYYSSILIFVNNPNYKNILDKIKTNIKESEFLVKINKELKDDWIETKMYLNDSKDDIVTVSFMIFHFPID